MTIIHDQPGLGEVERIGNRRERKILDHLSRIYGRHSQGHREDRRTFRPQELLGGLDCPRATPVPVGIKGPTFPLARCLLANILHLQITKMSHFRFQQ